MPKASMSPATLQGTDGLEHSKGRESFCPMLTESKQWAFWQEVRRGQPTLELGLLPPAAHVAGGEGACSPHVDKAHLSLCTPGRKSRNKKGRCPHWV